MAAQINFQEEFEKKLILSNKQWNDLVLANTVSTKIFTDTYYDYFDYSLTIKDTWLRSRILKDQKTFELKISKIANHAKSLVDVYDEYTKIEEIKNMLKIEGDFYKHLEEKFFIFCNLKTVRETIVLLHPDPNFNNIGFKLTKDTVTSCDQYGWEYSICELEYSYGPELEQNQKETLIKNIFEHYGWTYEYRYGKVLEYLRCFSPEHFNRLIGSGVCPENIAVI